MSERTYRERPETVRGFKFIRLKSGRLLSFWEAMDAAAHARTDLSRAVSRAFKLISSTSPELADWDLERLEWLLDDVEGWLAAVRTEIERQHGRRSKEERIALLRNTNGRTPEEAESFRRKADELEHLLEGAA